MAVTTAPAADVVAATAMRRTYGSLRLERGITWVIEALEPHVILKLKHLFPKIGRTQALPFRFDNTPSAAADLDWFTARYPLSMSDDDADALAFGRLDYDATQAELGRIVAPDWTPPKVVGLKPGEKGRDYQIRVAEMLARVSGLLCGDEVGLGKTYIGMLACLNEGALPAAIVCQPHLQGQWVAALERFTHLRVHAIRGTIPYGFDRFSQAGRAVGKVRGKPLHESAAAGFDVYVFRYTQLAGWFHLLESLRLATAIFDEIQELRTGPDTEKGRAALRLAGLCQFRLGLTATPIYNYGPEIHTIMSFLRPGLLGTRDEFLREWREDGEYRALGTYLRDQYAFIRRTKRDVGQEVPPVNKIVHVVDYNEAAAAPIEDRARALAQRATTGTFTERGQASRDLDLLVRQWTGVVKAKAVADLARILVEGGEPILLAGWHRDVYAIWLEALADLKPVMYTGSETPVQKKRAVDAFLAGESDIFIISLRSGVGLDGLQKRCSTVVVGELDWSPGVHHQLIGRVDREGQTSPVTALFPVIDEGSDPPMIEVLGLKASEQSQIIDPSLGAQSAHSDFSHVQRLVQRYLDKKGSGGAAEARTAQGGEAAA